ncbi:MAG: hypothetical protein GEU99_00650 [Luteitalea sp.]|nr:hypothetical protein [Luteitalea sp.]
MHAPAPPAPQPPHPVFLIEAAELGKEARALLRDEHDARGYMAALIETVQLVDAIRFLAHALPVREAIWWAWCCARLSAAEELPANQQAALGATERWIRQPTDEHRRSMLAIAEQAELGSPAGAAALAVFFSGGSITPPDAPEVAPPSYAAAKLIAGSVILAGVVAEPELAPEKYRGFITQGLTVVDRLNLWPPAPDRYQRKVEVLRK